MTTRSAEECEISRSCHSATFSIADDRRASDDAREAADPLGQRPGCACAASPTSPSARGRTTPAASSHLRPLRGAGTRAQRRATRRDRERPRQLRVPSRWRICVETSAPAPGRAVRTRSARPPGRWRRTSDRAGHLPTRMTSSARATRFRARSNSNAQPGELEAEGHRLGVDAVRAAHLQREPVLSARATTAAKRPVEPCERRGRPAPDLESERRVDDVGGGEAVVELAALRLRAARRPRRRRRRCRGGGSPRARRPAPAWGRWPSRWMASAASAGTTPSWAQAAVPLPVRPRATSRACPRPTRSRSWPGGSSGRSLAAV